MHIIVTYKYISLFICNFLVCLLIFFSKFIIKFSSFYNFITISKSLLRLKQKEREIFTKYYIFKYILKIYGSFNLYILIPK